VARTLMSALVALLLLAAPSGLAAAHPRDVDDTTRRTRRLVDSLGVRAAPAHYFIVLDVSTSMLEEHRYEQAEKALRVLLSALSPSDLITVIRFGETTTPFHGPVSVSAGGIDAFIEALPRPMDQASDFGAAMDDVADIIRKTPVPGPDYLPPTAVLVLTDAELYAPDSPDFAERDSPGWARVAKEYASLAAERGPIAAYALPLGTNARGVNLIREVMPNAASLTGTAAQQSDKLAELHDDANRRKAVQLVRADRNATVRASFAQAPPAPPGGASDPARCADAPAISAAGAADLTRERDLCLVLTSDADSIRLTADHLAVQDGGDLILGLPVGPVELRPGEPAYRIVRARTAEHTRSSRSGAGIDYPGSTRVTGRVRVTDAADYASLLRVAGPYVRSTRIDGGEITYIGRVHGEITWTFWLIASALGILVAVAACRVCVVLGPLPRGLRVEFALDTRTESFPGRWPALRPAHRLVWDKRRLTKAETTFRARRPLLGRGTTVVTARHRHGPVTLNTSRRVTPETETMMYGVKVRVVDTRGTPPDLDRPQPPDSPSDAMVTTPSAGEEPTATPSGVLVTTPPPSG